MKNNKKGTVALIIVLVLILVSIVGCFGDCGESSGGDGKSSCRNCGRSSVYALGYCKSCYKGFRNWQEDNGYS